MSVNATLKYVHKDHLGGTSAVTSDNGSLIESIKYFAFGNCRNSTGDLATDKLFTGQILDDTGLYYYNARYYDPTIGRFISPDTIIPNPANPQSFNRYSYCLNNPLKYIDPSGYDEQVGTVIIGGITYNVVVDNNGRYYVSDQDGNRTHDTWTFQELIDVIGDEMYWHGEYGPGGDQTHGPTVTINFNTNLGVKVPVHFVSEWWYKYDKSIVAELMRKLNGGDITGISMDFLGGVYLRYQLQYYLFASLYESTMHECEHYWEQSRGTWNGGGFFWYTSYISESWKNHDSRSAEKRANSYGQSQNPNINRPSTWDNIYNSKILWLALKIFL
jgi:RHS repeat-associated protein